MRLGGRGSEAGERTVILTVALGTILAPLNSTMIAVALPKIIDDFGNSVRAGGWLITSYLIVLAVVQPFAGRLGDRVGQDVPDIPGRSRHDSRSGGRGWRRQGGRRFGGTDPWRQAGYSGEDVAVSATLKSSVMAGNAKHQCVCRRRGIA